MHRAHLQGKNNVGQRRRFSHLVLSNIIMHDAFASNIISDDANSYCRFLLCQLTLIEFKKENGFN